MVGVPTDTRRVTSGQMTMTSTPVNLNGNLTYSSSNGSLNGPVSPDSPSDQVFLDGLSPVSSPTSTLDRRTLSSGSSGRKKDVDYGKFYNTSYLEKHGENYIKKGPPAAPNISPTHTNFHRPEGFSYKFSPQYGKSKKTDARSPSNGQGGMMGALVSSIQRKQIREVSKVSRTAVLKNEEPIKLSQFPGGNKPRPDEITKIERDDWPGPPSLAAVLPERLRERRKSRGETEDDEDDDIKVPIDPKLKKEIDEMSKMKDSPMAKVMLEKLEDSAHEVKTRTLDPRSASRTPAANREPHHAQRYENSLFASPSRTTERPRLHSVDDILLDRHMAKRSVVSLPRQPVVRPGYTLGFSNTRSKSSTLPAGVDGSYLNGSAIESDEDDDDPAPRKSYSDLDRLERKWQAMQLSSPGYDPELFKRNISSRQSTISEVSSYSFQRDKRRGSCISDGPPFLATQALDRRRKSSTFSIKQELCRDPTQPVSYEELKCVDGKAPKGYEKDTLERYLSNEDFEAIFNVKRDEFYRMPEWKRNDLKRKHELF